MGLKLNYIIIFIILFSLVSCDKKEKSYYDDGNIKSVYYLNSKNNKEGKEEVFYPTGELQSVVFYKDGVWTDSIVKYNKDGTYLSILYNKEEGLYLKTFENNILANEGKVDNNLNPIGWWKFYEDGNLFSEKETIIIDGNRMTNQELFYENNKMIPNKSKYYKFVSPDKMKKQTQYEFKIPFQLNELSPQENLLEEEYYFLIFSSHYNDDFSNFNSVKSDTIIPYKENEFLITLSFRNAGEKNFRGVIEKHTLNSEGDKLFLNKEKIYIKEVFYVE